MSSLSIIEDEGDGDQEDRKHHEQQQWRQRHSDDHDGDDNVVDPTTTRPKKRSRCLPGPTGTNIKIRRRRHLVVPQTDEELDTMVDAYCSHGHWQAGDDKKEEKTGDDSDGKVDPWRDVVVSALTSSTAFNDSTSRFGHPWSSHDTTTTTTINNDGTTNTKIQFDPHRTPLMMKFYKSVGVDPDDLKFFNGKVEEEEKSNDDGAPSSSTAPSSFSQNKPMNPQVDLQDDNYDIDNPENSTLRPGQHRRYLQLIRQHNFRVAMTTISSSSSTHHHQQQQQNVPLAQQNEFKKLHRQVVTEQERYHNALDRFHTRHRSRYLIGFSSPSLSSSSTVISQTYANKGTGKNADPQSSTTTMMKDRGGDTQQRRPQQEADNRLRAYSQWACQQISRKAEQVWKKRWQDVDHQVLHNSEPEQHEGTEDKRNTDIGAILPRMYGPTRQIISLSNPTATALTTAQENWLDINDLNVVSVSLELDEKGRHGGVEDLSLLGAGMSETLLAATLSVGKIVPPPKHCVVDKPDQTLLRHDSNAIDLAMKHSCKILTTMETLEEMLHLPGQATTDWIVTTTSRNHGKLMILDLPLIRPFSSPRACLEYSFRHSLYQMCNDEGMEPKKMPSKNVSDEDNLIRYQYYVFTVPPLNPTASGNKKISSQDHQKVKVLVRVPAYKGTNGQSLQTVLLQPHLEYFADQGRPKEMIDGYERAVMILKLAILGPNISGLLVRINILNCQILACDNITIPKAMNTPQGAAVVSPMSHVQNMVQILHSVLTLSDVDSILCLPGRRDQDRLDPYSISVHSCTKIDKLQHPRQQQQQQQEEDPAIDHGSTVSASTIDLGDVLEKAAGTVRLGDHAVTSCRRDWIWDNDGQIPNTFPPRDGK